MLNERKMKQESEKINLKVLGHDNTTVQFKIKTHTPLRKLMNAYSNIVGISVESIRFRFDGMVINENDTPTSLEMEEGDTIEAHQQQTGGMVPELIISKGVYHHYPVPVGRKPPCAHFKH